MLSGIIGICLYDFSGMEYAAFGYLLILAGTAVLLSGFLKHTASGSGPDRTREDKDVTGRNTQADHTLR